MLAYKWCYTAQAEWEEVASRADLLKQENSSLKEELKQLQEKCDNLTSENTSFHVSFAFCSFCVDPQS